jgi:hypothetical protein
MKPLASLARLEVALIETQYALSDLWHESEANAEVDEKLTREIADSAIRISVSILHLLKIMSNEYAGKRSSNNSATELVR